MKKIIAILFLLLPLSAGASEYIVKLNGFSVLNFSTNTIMGMSIMDMHSEGALVKVEIPDDQFLERITELKRNHSVEYIVENFELHAIQSEMTQEQLREQWAIMKVNAEKAWKLSESKGSHNVIVAVIDTGVDYTHESLAPNMVPGFDFKDKDADPMDETSSRNKGHGTHCAGIIGATGAVENGIVGLSPNVSIMPLRFLGPNGSGSLMDGIKAIDYAIENKAKIISASWGAKVAESKAKPLIEAVKRASDAGVIFVSAAGNNGTSNDETGFYPANAKFANTITVAASNEQDGKPRWSNFGQRVVDIASPGNNIMSTIPNNEYASLRGTSMAAPLVSGLVALLASENPDITGAQALALIQSTGAKVNIETGCNCRIDAASAMEALQQNKLTVVPAALTLAVNDKYQFDGFQGEAPYTFETTNESVATIDRSGMLTAKAKGQTQVRITDAIGNMSSSLAIQILARQVSKPPKCPFNREWKCRLACLIPIWKFCRQ